MISRYYRLHGLIESEHIGHFVWKEGGGNCENPFVAPYEKRSTIHQSLALAARQFLPDTACATVLAHTQRCKACPGPKNLMILSQEIRRFAQQHDIENRSKPPRF
ncbi:hypothetical protein AUC45_07135 [Erythrobacter sp. YT30]|nr:hypothetical protein AUC45_07135 [Erythrobacter sp. YT30]